MIFRKDTWSRYLFLFYFFKKKQNNKKSPKYNFLLRKESLWKTKVGSRGQVTYWEGMVVNRSTPLSP